MPTPITRSTHPESLWPGIKDWFGFKYDEYPLEWTELFERDTSNKHFERDVEATGFGLVPQKDEGDSVQYDTAQEGYANNYQHLTYASGWIITEEAIEDNLYPELAMRYSGALAFAFRQTEEIVHANIFNRAFNASYTGGDGVQMVSNAHPTLSGNQSNLIGTPADLSEASLESLAIQVMGAKDPRGLTIKLIPRKLIVPKEEIFNATRLVATQLRPGTDLNDVNAMQTLGYLPDGVAVNHYFTDTDAWFLKTNCDRGLVHFDRIKLGALQQDNEFNTGNARAKNRTRYSCGWSNWRQIFASPGA